MIKEKINMTKLKLNQNFTHRDTDLEYWVLSLSEDVYTNEENVIMKRNGEYFTCPSHIFDVLFTTSDTIESEKNNINIHFSKDISNIKIQAPDIAQLIKMRDKK